MKILIPIILAIFMTQSCSGSNTNNPISEEKSESEELELEFSNENDFIYDDGSDDDNN